MTASLDGTLGVTFPDSTTQATGAFYGGLGFRNRIINGAMVIDQRNAGASISVSSNTGTQFVTDRFLVQGTSAEGVFSAQQLSATPPTGFRNYVRVQTTTASATPASGSLYVIEQVIEGYNIADLGFGAAGASTVTFSFWIRSSLTGTFSGSLKNGNAYNRSYPFTYTISAANTWEYKTVTVAGDTSGTWQTGNLGGLIVYWDLGCGSSLLSTANSWQGANYNGVTGSTRLISTLNATMDITGVQLEKGSTATSFDYRPYGTELALCQRYFTSFVGSVAYSQYGIAEAVSSVKVRFPMQCPVPMRAAPTFSTAGSGFVWALDRIGSIISALTLDYATTQIQSISGTGSSLTTGQAGSINAGNFTNTSMSFSAEL